MDSSMGIVRRGIVSPSPTELLSNTLGFGIVAFMFFILRMYNRLYIMSGLRKEDYVMILAMCFYTVLLTLINYSADYATNLYPPEDAVKIFGDPQVISDRIYGSKLVIPLEQSMLAVTWLVKGCIWVFISAITKGTTYARPMRYLMGYIVFGYLVIQICYFFILCRPFKQYWAMPVNNPQCTTYAHYSIIQAVFNISSDLGLIGVPLWIAWTVQLPLNRKLMVAIPFFMACFTILAAILNKVYNFKSPLTTTYQLWYIREASVAIWVGNIICTWQLIQKIFNVDPFGTGNNPLTQQAALPTTTPRETLDSDRNRPSGWRARWLSIRIAAGSLLTKSTRKNSRQSDTTVGTNETRDTFYKVKAEPSISQQHLRTDSNIPMTLRGDGYDASHAVEYRRMHNIV